MAGLADSRDSINILITILITAGQGSLSRNNCTRLVNLSAALFVLSLDVLWSRAVRDVCCDERPLAGSCNLSRQLRKGPSQYGHEFMKTTRLFIMVEAAAFIAAALTHFGILVDRYQHRQAGTAESVIGIVLLAGLILALIRPSWTNRIGVWVQAFALLGTLVGIFTIAVGVGPRTMPDIVYHACIVVVLLAGLTVAVRAQGARKV